MSGQTMTASGGIRKEQRCDPGEMRRGDDRIVRAARLSPAGGDQGFRVARRVQLFQPTLSEHQEGGNLRRAEEIEEGQFQLQANATLRNEISPNRSAPSATGLPPRLR